MKTSASAILLTLTCLMASSASAKDVTVSINGLKYRPTVVEVSPGDAVIWTNDDDRGHTVVADDGSFNSGEIGIGGQFRQKFKAAGEFSYHCDHHPRMRGKVVVKGK
jgi:plastocyanin